jgi:hypothetical protein
MKFEKKFITQAVIPSKMGITQARGYVPRGGVTPSWTPSLDIKYDTLLATLLDIKMELA